MNNNNNKKCELVYQIFMFTIDCYIFDLFSFFFY